LALIESQRRGWTDLLVMASTVVGVVGLLAFVAWERRVPNPMLPLALFAHRNFAGANLTTALVYGGLSMGSLSITLDVQEVAGYKQYSGSAAPVPNSKRYRRFRLAFPPTSRTPTRRTRYWRLRSRNGKAVVHFEPYCRRGGFNDSVWAMIKTSTVKTTIGGGGGGRVGGGGGGR
jgi:hypothetical protein